MTYTASHLEQIKNTDIWAIWVKTYMYVIVYWYMCMLLYTGICQSRELNVYSFKCSSSNFFKGPIKNHSKRLKTTRDVFSTIKQYTHEHDESDRLLNTWDCVIFKMSVMNLVIPIRALWIIHVHPSDGDWSITRNADPRPDLCWSIVCDAGPTLINHWLDVTCWLIANTSRRTLHKNSQSDAFNDKTRCGLVLS